MQKYTPLGDTATETVKQALINHEDNINSIRSSNSGSAFPTENLVAGMKCYRTDLKEEYMYTGESWERVSLFNGVLFMVDETNGKVKAMLAKESK